MIKLKPVTWVIIISIAVIVPLALVLVVTRLILNPAWSWWWTGGVFIFQVIVGVISGIIILIVKLTKAQPPKIKLDPKTAKAKAINEIKYDDDNPDNFVPEKQIIKRVGQEGSPRTPILYLAGKGSEKNEKIDVLVNLDNPKMEMSILRGETDETVLETIRTMAENPEAEVTEKSTISTDAFGRPVQTIVRKGASQAEKAQREDTEKAEEANKF